MKTVIALPKLIFDSRFSNKSFLTHKDSCFISIIDEDNNENKYDTSIENFLQVKMWDIEEDLYENEVLKYKKPSEEVLQKIVDFLKFHQDKKNFVIHCSAGISRSGAVVTYIYDKFHNEISKEEFKRLNKYINPNLYILTTLKKLDTDEDFYFIDFNSNS